MLMTICLTFVLYFDNLVIKAYKAVDCWKSKTLDSLIEEIEREHGTDEELDSYWKVLHGMD
jgi:hypothetical protein